jgi:hypothetical protein
MHGGRNRFSLSIKGKPADLLRKNELKHLSNQLDRSKFKSIEK